MILSPGRSCTWTSRAATPLLGRGAASASSSSLLADVERDHILRVLEQAGWRIKGPGSASVRLGLKPSTLYFRMKKLGHRQAVGRG